MSPSDWFEKYREVSKTLPKPGSILKPIEGKAILHLEETPGKAIFIFGRVFVPEILDIEPAWYLQGASNSSYSGLKCIVLPRARTKVLNECEIIDNKIEVASLKVISLSQTGKSLLCEVEEI